MKENQKKRENKVKKSEEKETKEKNKNKKICEKKGRKVKKMSLLFKENLSCGTLEGNNISEKYFNIVSSNRRFNNIIHY